MQGNLDTKSSMDIPTLDVKIKGKQPYGPLLNLIPFEAFVSTGVLHLNLTSADERWILKIALDFAEERLKFDIFNGVYAAGDDDESPEYADGAAELQRFFGDYCGNGALTIFDAEAGKLLSRCDPYIPLNMMPNPDGSKKQIAEWKEKAAARRAAIEQKLE